MRKKSIRVVVHYPDSYRNKTDAFHAHLEEANTFMVSLAVKHLGCSQKQLRSILDKLTAPEKK